MADGFAVGFTATGKVSRSTHRPTLLILASMGVQTVIVNAAFNLEACYIWIAFIAVLTGAHRLVFNDPTESMFSTSTRILTELIYAGIPVSAFIISGTSGKNWGQSLTTGIISAYISVGTGADHGSDRHRVDHRTAGRAGARIQGFTE